MPKCPKCENDYFAGDLMCPNCFEPLSIVPDSEKIESNKANKNIKNDEELSGDKGGFSANPFASLFGDDEEDNNTVVIDDEKKEIKAVEPPKTNLPEDLEKAEAKAKHSNTTQNKQTSQKKKASLVVTNGSGINTEFLISGHSVMIGRWDPSVGAFVEIDLTDIDISAKVSRMHARITEENGTYFIEDLGSTNGTYINRSERLIPGDKVRISDGDEIIIGKMFLRFVVK